MILMAHDPCHANGADRRAVLADLLRGRASGKSLAQPLSRGQKALWFLHQSAPDSPAYHVGFAARIHTDLDVRALQRALQALVDRHPMLRASFRLQDGGPVQDIYAHRGVRLEIADCAGLSDADLRERVVAAYQRPFDLEREPLLRAGLFVRGPDDSVLLLTVHHIIYDGWSLWLNLDELGPLYGAEAAGERARLPALRGSYRTFITAQEEMLASPRGAALWDYWREQLAGELPLLDLPTDRPRPSAQSLRGASHPLALDAPLTQALKELARSEGVTPFTLLLAAYQVLLGRYARQDEVLVGSPVAGRSDPALADTVGCFVNLVALRAHLGDDPSFRSFLRATHRTVLQAIEHQDLPFPVLVERLKLRRDPSYSPVCQALFVLQKPQRLGSAIGPAGAAGSERLFEWGGLVLEHYPLPQQEGQFDLELELIELDGVYAGSLKYNTDMFDPDTVGRIGASFTALLRSVVRDADQPIHAIDLLSPTDREWLAQRQSAPAQGLPAAECVHVRFARQAAATPEAVALIFEDRTLTYRELDERANRLAHRLRGRGVGPETLVGICAERSFEMVLGILAILKAGGAYLPLDPALPRDRLAFIVEDSAAKLILTQSHLREIVDGAGAELILLGGDPPAVAEHATAPVSGVGPDNLIYVMYTSGTTGRPKGVRITHRNVDRLFTATAPWYRFGPDDVWTLFHSFAFDVSVWELWGALLHGGRIVVVPYLVSRSPAEFLDLLARHRVTVLNQSPSAFRLLVPAEERKPLPEPLSLRLIVFAGEALDLKSLEPWFDRHGDASPLLVNMYGITETTVHSTYRPVTRGDLVRVKSTIGVPIPDLRLHLLDRNLKPVPVGVAGEIFVGGDGVARGYLNRPELTAERFLPDPFSDRPDATIYKSGDLARYLADGDIEYLGRLDKQVKIRGFRVELGEIEAVLCQHAEVAAAVVIAKPDPRGGTRLIAYTVPSDPDHAPDGADLRSFLAERLPEYMVPASFAAIARLPLTGNGKLDHKALPEPEGGRTDAGPVVPPRDTTEQRLVGIWEKVLRLHPIGVQDDFFALGGHSLLAVHLMTEIEHAFRRELPIAALFRHPTIEQLARHLREDDDGAWSPLVPIRIGGDRRPFFCIAGGGGNVLYFHELAHHLPPDRPFFGLQLRGVDGRFEPLTRVEDIAAECARAIRETQPRGPYHLGGHCFGGLVAFETAQQLLRAGERVDLVAILDTPAPRGELGRLNTIAVDDDAGWLAKIGGIFSEASGQALAIDLPVLRELESQARLDYVQVKLKEAGLLPPGDGIAQVRGFLKVFVANSKARYRPAPGAKPLPIALFRARDAHPDYDYAAAEDTASLGWQAFAAGPVPTHAVPGNHITMMSGTGAAELARHLARHLDHAAAPEERPAIGSPSASHPSEEECLA